MCRQRTPRPAMNCREGEVRSIVVMGYEVECPQLDMVIWDEETGLLNAIIETAQGARSKYDFDDDTGIFMLKKSLPAGMLFPHNFGFVPRTLADDGDPLDILVLADEPAFAGCRIPCRLL